MDKINFTWNVDGAARALLRRHEERERVQEPITENDLPFALPPMKLGSDVSRLVSLTMKKKAKSLLVAEQRAAVALAKVTGLPHYEAKEALRAAPSYSSAAASADKGKSQPFIKAICEAAKALGFSVRKLTAADIKGLLTASVAQGWPKTDHITTVQPPRLPSVWKKQPPMIFETSTFVCSCVNSEVWDWTTDLGDLATYRSARVTGLYAIERPKR